MSCDVPLTTFARQSISATNSPSAGSFNQLTRSAVSQTRMVPTRQQPSALRDQTSSTSPIGSDATSLTSFHSSPETHQSNHTSSSQSSSTVVQGSTPTDASRNPVRRLGRFVKSSLGSDFTTGVIALCGLIGAFVIGIWGVKLARRQLDLGEWTFCKSYPDDTVSRSSSEASLLTSPSKFCHQLLVNDTLGRARLMIWIADMLLKLYPTPGLRS